MFLYCNVVVAQTFRSLDRMTAVASTVRAKLAISTADGTDYLYERIDGWREGVKALYDGRVQERRDLEAGEAIGTEG